MAFVSQRMATLLVRPTAGGRRPAARAKALKEHELRPENVPGSFAVDRTCIDCDTCRWMAPDVYERVGTQSAVIRQPSTEEERLRAAQALLACPTHSIQLRDKQKGVVKEAAASFPHPIPGADGIFHLGYHSAASYGAASYFVQRAGGNLMIDCPRFDKTLLKNIQALGGVSCIVLTHRDDVCDHAQWAEALGAPRLIHRGEATQRQGTVDCEVQLEGKGPWRLPDGGEDAQLLHTPGHTADHIVLMLRTAGGAGVLFPGDHLFFRADGNLHISTQKNWFSVDRQLESVALLRGLPFLHVLPGHGRPGSLASEEEREAQLQALLEREGFLVAA